jgi:hypothetical protein
MSLSVSLEQRAEKSPCRRTYVAQTKLSFLPCGGAPDPPDRLIDPLKDQRRVPQEDGPSRSQADGSSSAIKQKGSKIVFQFLDGPAQSGLGDVEPTRRFGVAQLFGDSLKIAEVAEFHRCRCGI